MMKKARIRDHENRKIMKDRKVNKVVTFVTIKTARRGDIKRLLNVFEFTFIRHLHF
jgi:hypothetical protein